MAKYLEFESMTEGLESKVRQDLKFKTGNFVWKIKFNILYIRWFDGRIG